MVDVTKDKAREREEYRPGEWGKCPLGEMEEVQERANPDSRKKRMTSEAHAATDTAQPDY